MSSLTTFSLRPSSARHTESHYDDFVLRFDSSVSVDTTSSDYGLVKVLRIHFAGSLTQISIAARERAMFVPPAALLPYTSWATSTRFERTFTPGAGRVSAACTTADVQTTSGVGCTRRDQRGFARRARHGIRKSLLDTDRLYGLDCHLSIRSCRAASYRHPGRNRARFA